MGRSRVSKNFLFRTHVHTHTPGLRRPGLGLPVVQPPPLGVKVVAVPCEARTRAAICMGCDACNLERSRDVCVCIVLDVGLRSHMICRIDLCEGVEANAHMSETCSYT